MDSIIISTHNKLIFGNNKTIHSGKGVYYGAFKGENNSIWVISRGSNEENLLNMDMNGVIINKKIIPSKFTHDAVRYIDKVYITDCGNGGVLILNYPYMSVYKNLNIFTIANHLNTLLYDNGILWCLLHNLGKSILVGINPETGEKLQIYNNVGFQSHGLVKYNNGFLILSSAESSLLYVTSEKTKVLLTYPPYFLKGLVKVGDVVYFGASPPLKRTNRGDINLNCDLISFNLISKDIIKVNLTTCGLLNNIIKYY
jgi:hypothetical protein